MRAAYGRFVPETVAECAEMLVMSVGHSHAWSDEMVRVAREWESQFTPDQVAALGMGEGPDDYYLDLLPTDDIKTLALAYALSEFAARMAA